MTPKKYLHDALADHTDRGYAHAAATTQVHTAGVNCGFDHQVVELPTTATGFVELNPLPQPLLPQYASAITALLHTALLHIENKGPPATV